MGHGSIRGSLQRITAQTNTTNINTDNIRLTQKIKQSMHKLQILIIPVYRYIPYSSPDPPMAMVPALSIWPSRDPLAIPCHRCSQHTRCRSTCLRSPALCPPFCETSEVTHADSKSQALSPCDLMWLVAYIVPNRYIRISYSHFRADSVFSNLNMGVATPKSSAWCWYQ